MQIENKIKKRIKELKKMRDCSITGGTRTKYNFVIAELGFILEK